MEGADRNEFFAPAIQVIYYLDDVDAESHCTSLIPESAETKRQLPKTRDGKSGWGEGVLRIADSETAYVDPDKPIWTDSFGRTNPRRIGRADVHAPAGLLWCSILPVITAGLSGRRSGFGALRI